jgi:hypothetical protein
VRLGFQFWASCSAKKRRRTTPDVERNGVFHEQADGQHYDRQNVVTNRKPRQYQPHYQCDDLYDCEDE